MEQFTRIWVQVLDRKDGSFLVRYRMYATYQDLHIHVLHKNKHVAKSPYILKGTRHLGCAVDSYFSASGCWRVFGTGAEFNNTSVFSFACEGQVYHEGCDCPQASGAEWEAYMHCPPSFPQIDSDLSLFPSVDLDRNAEEIPRRFGQRQSLCHYTIVDNKVHHLVLEPMLH